MQAKSTFEIRAWDEADAEQIPGGLAGLCGHAEYHHDADGAAFTLDYEID